MNVRASDLHARRVNPQPIIPDNREGEDESVDTIKNTAVAGEERAGVLNAGAALVGRFEQIAHLAGDVAGCGHSEHVNRGDVYASPVFHGERDQEGAEEAGDRAFPGLLRAEMRDERMAANGPADEISGSVAHPGDDQ